MTKLVWDQVGERRYETGVDRGVLYLPDGKGVPWNGLTSVEEDLSDIETSSFHFDGVKYLDTRSVGDFSATLKAFTYPEEFSEFEGLSLTQNNMLLGNQPVTSRFGLSYRTRVGNDLNGTDQGYKIHILYNLTATPDNRAFSTLSDRQNPLEFGWKITGVPEWIPGHKPTAHVIFDTTLMNRFLIRDLEDILYGSGDIIDGGTPRSAGYGVIDGGSPALPGHGLIYGGSPVESDLEPRLPSLAELFAYVEAWRLIPIIDNGDGTWTATGPDEFVKYLDPTTFQITNASARFIDEDVYEITTTDN